MAMRWLASVLCVCFVMLADAAFAQPRRADVVIDAGRPGPVISRYIYSQFSEHLGRGIYGGIWVGPDSTIANTRGIRNDVVAALRELDVPSVRWPGGCFADLYHWRDGIGPRRDRPVRLNSFWGGVEEPNAFGTHEFFDFVGQIGADAYVSANVATGSTAEMTEWLEYMTSPSRSTLAQQRRANGRDAPWAVPFLGIGNEAWGCGGGMRPERYADLLRQYAMMARAGRDPAPAIVAVGPAADDYRWTEVVMREAAASMDALSLHYYTLPTGDWARHGAARGFDEAEWIATLAQTLRIGEMLDRHTAIMDRYDPDRRVALYVDEWGSWYDSEGSGLEQANTLRDAVLAAVNLNIFHERADRVRLAAIAQMVNVLQALILTDGERMLRTPTYHVYAMYRPFREGTLLPSRVRTPDYRLGGQRAPSLHVSAARAASGEIVMALVNLDPNRALTVSAEVRGARLASVTGQILTAGEMDAHNSFDDPDHIAPVAFHDASVSEGRLTVALPAKSVVVLTLR